MSGNDVRRRTTDDAIGTAMIGLAAGAAVGMGIIPGQIREMTEPGRAAAAAGADVRGTSSVQQFELGLGGGMDAGAEFDVTLPGTALNWTVKFSARGTFPTDVTLTPVLSSVVYDGTNGDGAASKSTAAAIQTFYGGDTVNCAAVITGPDSGPFTIILDFAATPV